MSESQTFYSSAGEDVSAVSPDRRETSHTMGAVEAGERVAELGKRLIVNLDERQEILGELKDIHSKAQQWVNAASEVLEKHG